MPEGPTLAERFNSVADSIAGVEDESTREALYELLWALKALALLL
ncbi:hypothetical protein PBI_ROPE_88 [Mycobacterium phage Rope]|uniref:Uncharacterized protein n=7 Tax=Papyrusvirus TaxID=1982554 RepID=A0A0Y0AEK7_9CAUD|nr:hypothetical protein N842_gp088 [Mycobacterium phage Papyrus]AMB17302.1 hypothetical protein SEA_WEISS13_88 [Mycobacterium phage Weiss13]ARW57175.1 hypothetical protein SEA_ZENON_90 [Mycobacterium phage Zenon]AVO21488.1 hypothetical protein PBI_NILO_91 [Mycobacterium phage Nilo]AYQ98662.1 hypothetical protein SEA_RIPARIAN_90 [Mycobacterium phage Riparian]QCG78193.1 hypothetical protein SEA_CANDLE_86 [Mycobacterium phage Candle]QNN99747.1 hypothetical protein PBI_ROPE_88 [Mycobacterium phag